MSDAVTIREHVLDALHGAGPHGLTMAAIAGIVSGPWRSRDVEAIVRRLWEVNELARRPDGTFVVTEKVGGDRDHPSVQRKRSKLDQAVRRVADRGRREGYSSEIRSRVVDPGLLKALCPHCRSHVHPRLDGTCPACGTQTGANHEERVPRRRYRRRRLHKGQRGYGPVCPKCGGPKGVQAHSCRNCGSKRRAGRQLGPRPTHKPAKHISDELLLECRRLYLSGLSIRQVAERVHPYTTYASVNACKTSLFSLFKTRGWKLRPQREVTRARNFKHGRKPRTVSPEQERAYRRMVMRDRGWKTIHGPGQPTCKGVKRQHPNKGKPCDRPAMEGSEFCYSHDPKRELARQAHLARMRAKGTYREPLLPVAPFSAWLASLHAQLGGWREVGALIGVTGTEAHRWAKKGGGRSVAERVIRRSAEHAGTTLEAIYGQDLAAARANRRAGLVPGEPHPQEQAA